MRRVLYRTALAVLLAGNALGLAVLVKSGGGMPPLIGCVSLAYAGTVVLGYAVGAAVHVGREHACRRRRHWQGAAGRARRAEPPQGRSEHLDAPAAAYAAFADVWALPGTARHAVRPTVPMPVVDQPTLDLTQWGGYEYGEAR